MQQQQTPQQQQGSVEPKRKPPEMLRMRHPSCPAIRPQSIPNFEIPRRPRSVERFDTESSLYHRRRTESLNLNDRDLLVNKRHGGLRRRNTLSATKMTELVDNDSGYDPRHIPQAMTPYGFPRIVISPTASQKESLFHELTPTGSRSHLPSRTSRRDSGEREHGDTWQCLSRPRCDSGISGISDGSDPSTTKSRTSTFSSISEYECLPGKEPCQQSRVHLERKYSCFAEDTPLNDWGYSSGSSTPGEDSLAHRRFSADTVLNNYTGRPRSSNNAVEETERSELLKQLHALCIKQQAGQLRDLGEIEYWLRYDFSRHTLKVLVLRAENVGGHAASDKVSTYVRVTLKTDDSRISQQTKVVKHTRDPIFDEELTFSLRPVDVDIASLQVQVFRQRKLTTVLGGPVFLGMVSSQLKGLLVTPLKRIREDLAEEPEEGDPMRMNLSVCYKPRRQKLEVTIVKVAELPRSNIFGLPDTEVKIKVSQITDGEVKSSSSKTKTKRWNANPVFKEAFSFPVSDIQNLRDGLSVTCTVVCQDHLRKNKSYGKVGLGLSSTQESEREHWKEVLNNPGFPCNRWHSLVEEKAAT